MQEKMKIEPVIVHTARGTENLYCTPLGTFRIAPHKSLTSKAKMLRLYHSNGGVWKDRKTGSIDELEDCICDYVKGVYYALDKFVTDRSPRKD